MGNLRVFLVLGFFLFSAASFAENKSAVASMPLTIYDFPDSSAHAVGLVAASESVSVFERVGAWSRISEYRETDAGRRAGWVETVGLVEAAPEVPKATNPPVLQLASPPEKKERIDYPHATSHQRDLILYGESLVRDRMKDPDSAKFRNVFLTGNLKSVCGEVNAKNGFGAYSGYERFVSNGKGSTFLESELTSMFDIMWNTFCQ